MNNHKVNADTYMPSFTKKKERVGREVEEAEGESENPKSCKIFKIVFKVQN